MKKTRNRGDKCLVLMALVIVFSFAGCAGDKAEEVTREEILPEEPVETHAQTFDNTWDIRADAAQDLLMASEMSVDYDHVPLREAGMHYLEVDFSGDQLADGCIYAKANEGDHNFLFFFLNEGNGFKLIETEYPISVEKDVTAVDVKGEGQLVGVEQGDEVLSILKYADDQIYLVGSFYNMTSKWTNTDLGEYITEQKIVDASNYDEIHTEIYEYFMSQDGQKIDVSRESVISSYLPNEAVDQYAIKSDYTTYHEKSDVIEMVLSANTVEGLNTCPEIISETVLATALDYYLDHRFEFPVDERITYIEDLIDVKTALSQMSNAYSECYATNCSPHHQQLIFCKKSSKTTC